jgi:hypothetical protein
MQIGETEWAKSGRYMGTTDIKLALKGTKQGSLTAARPVGTGKPLGPSQRAHPRQPKVEGEEDV